MLSWLRWQINYGFPGTATLSGFALDQPQNGHFSEYDQDLAAVAKVAQALVSLRERQSSRP
jgi:hypothetical protein